MKGTRLSNLALKIFKADDNKIVQVDTLFILLLKATRSLDLALKAFKTNNNKIVGVGNKANKTIVNSSKNNKSRNLMYILNIGAIKEPTFLISNAKKAFNYLWLIFIKAPML